MLTNDHDWRHVKHSALFIAVIHRNSLWTIYQRTTRGPAFCHVIFRAIACHKTTKNGRRKEIRLYVLRLMQDVCQSLCRLIVMAADNSSKLIVAMGVGSDIQRHLALSVISMVLVSNIFTASFNGLLEL